ncbi:hypothetical protein NESM_000555200 [Novymonas esmeraldas]|uniref:Uncharacterized protein n=1 Tax=Novymonas esmeraldas TaxID=1808958 RepID=A0AAW0ETC1_9TRYP
MQSSSTPCIVASHAESEAAPSSDTAATGQRVTLTAKHAAAHTAADPKAAEVVRVSLFPERVVTLRSAGDASPGWNDVVG